MKKLLFLFLAGVISFSSCKKDDPDPVQPSAPKAKVMLGNMSVDVTGANAKINGTAVSGATGLAYLASTGYISVDPVTNVPVSFTTSSNLSLQSRDVTLSADNYYSVFLTGTITKPEIAFTMDNLSDPSSGNAKIRLYHLSNDTLKLTATAGSTTIASNITYKNVSSFTEVPAGTMNLVVADPNAISETLTLTGQKLEAGKIYTIIKTGIKDGTGDAAYKLTLLTNNK